jgi:hypothetical protein
LMAGLNLRSDHTSMRYCYAEPRTQGAFAVCVSQLCFNFGDTDRTQGHRGIHTRSFKRGDCPRALCMKFLIVGCAQSLHMSPRCLHASPPLSASQSPSVHTHSALSTDTALLNSAPTSVVCAFPDCCLHISSRCLHTSSRSQRTETSLSHTAHLSLIRFIRWSVHFLC